MNVFAEQVDVKPGGLCHFHLCRFWVSAVGEMESVLRQAEATGRATDASTNPGIESSEEITAVLFRRKTVAET